MVWNLWYTDVICTLCLRNSYRLWKHPSHFLQNNIALTESATEDTYLSLQPIAGIQEESLFCTLISRWVKLREINTNLCIEVVKVWRHLKMQRI